jgi:hypothetical protein
LLYDEGSAVAFLGEDAGTYLGHARLADGCRLRLARRRRGGGAIVHLTLLLDTGGSEGRLVEFLALRP